MSHFMHDAVKKSLIVAAIIRQIVRLHGLVPDDSADLLVAAVLTQLRSALDGCESPSN
jgi:hypothetical protein